MIPIECPRCGRTGKVPPDRLNARLICKGCQAAFHMDPGGRMVLGDPGAGRAAARPTRSAPAIEFDLAETWRGMPRPARVGVPSLLILVAGWMWFPGLSSTPAFKRPAEAIGHALLEGDRAAVVALATPDSAGAAEKWYDLMREPMAEKGAGTVRPDSALASVVDGDPEQAPEFTAAVALTTDTVLTVLNLPMVKSGGEWRFDAARSLALAEAERAAAAAPVRMAKKR